MKKLLLALGLFATTQVYAQDQQIKDMMGEQGMQQLLALMGSTVDIAPSYTFPLSLHMVVQPYKNGKPTDANEMKMYINNDKGYFGVKVDDKAEGSDMLMIYNDSNGDMVILNDKDKSVMGMNTSLIMNSDFVKSMLEDGKKDSENMKCKKTGKTKSISGYSSQQYVCENPEKQGRYELWMTDQLKIDLAKNVKNTPLSTYFSKINDVEGMLLEGDFYEKGQQQAHIQVKNIDPKANITIKTEGYKQNPR